MNLNKVLWGISVVFIIISCLELILVYQRKGGSLQVSDQPLGETIKISKAILNYPGFIVIKKKNSQKEAFAGKDSVLFQSGYLENGDYTDIILAVPYREDNTIDGVTLTSDDSLVFTLYIDDGNKVFDLNDRPYKNLFGSETSRQIDLKTN